MKKIFILLVMLISVASVSAQRVMKADTYIYKYVGLAGDTVNVSNDSTWNHTVQINKREGVFYNASVKVADATANAACKVILRGKIFDTDSWTTIETKEWKGAGTDTIINFTQNTNKQYYRYIDFKLSGTATKAKLSVINLSLKR